MESTGIKMRYWRIMDQLSDAVLADKHKRAERLLLMAVCEAAEYREVKAKEPSASEQALRGVFGDLLTLFPTIRNKTN